MPEKFTDIIGTGTEFGTEMVVDQNAALLITNREFGNVVPNDDPNDVWHDNRPWALKLLSGYTTATQVVRMKTKDAGFFIDLDREDYGSEVHKNGDLLVRTNGLVSSQPWIMNLHPADCAGIAVDGISGR